MELSQDFQKSIEEDLRKKRKGSGSGQRPTDLMPLCAFTPKNWVSFFRKKKKEIDGETCEVSMHNQIGVLTKDIQPIVFTRFQWSARDFARFLINQIEFSKESKKKFALSMMRYNKKVAKWTINEHHKKCFLNRERDRFESAIYLPYYRLTTDQNDLCEIFRIIEDNATAFFWNYGIPNYHRYFQVEHKMSFEEAEKKTTSSMINIIKTYKEDSVLMEKLLVGFVRSSSLWGPYTSSAKRGGESKNPPVDWRDKYSKVWDKFNLKSSNAWKSAYEMNFHFSLESVRKLFS